MRRMIIMLMLCSFLIVVPTNGMCKSNVSQTTEMQNESVDEIKISVTIRPIKDSVYCYNFSTNSKSQIRYIVHLLNSMSLVDDEKMINGCDIPIVNINIIKEDGMVDKIGFVAGRFYDTNNKQYAVDRNEYNRFLDFIYALKTEKIILNDEVTFEPSEWAKTDIEKAKENELVPKWNQINYKGKINRLEVCQLVDNFLNKKNYINNNSADNPFSDTTDKAIINLFHLGVINGKSDSEFCPYNMITREEFAKILSNTYHCMKSEIMLDSSKILYKDQDKVSDWAMDSVNDMTSLGVFKGNEYGEFEPQNGIKKEEVIVTLLRLCDLS